MTATVIITFTAKPEMAADFKGILESVQEDLPKVEGCESVQIFCDKANSNVFTLVEAWESESAHKKHIEGVIASGGWDAIAAHLQSDPVSSYYSRL